MGVVIIPGRPTGNQLATFIEGDEKGKKNEYYEIVVPKGSIVKIVYEG